MGANRLLTCVGAVLINLNAQSPSGSSGQSQTGSYTFFVGPTLTRSQFHRAIRTASPKSWAVTVDSAIAGTIPSLHNVSLGSLEADFDEEGQRVEARLEGRAQVEGALFLSKNSATRSLSC
jgi:hypothetical protein